MRIILYLLLTLLCLSMAAQSDLVISGQTYTNSSDTWSGVNIPRSAPTRLVFKNNIISSGNRFGYLLQAGDEAPASTNNNLDGAVITGNKLNWSGTDMEVIPHGIFTGHNKDVIIRYNYLDNIPMGIIRKSGNSMGNTAGGVAYNIVKGGAVGMVVKGMSNVNVFNNTFYNDRTTDQTWRPLLHIYTNTDGGRYSVAHGTKVYNNIFYTKYRTPAITISDEESLTGFESDYNVFWCETGNPLFIINNAGLTFEQWQAMGYDTHSIVMDPRFRDLINFVPDRRIDRGLNLGQDWSQGLSISAQWGRTDPATISQNGPWQVGAVIHGEEGGQSGAFEITQSVLTNNSPATVEISFSMDLLPDTPTASSFVVNVNSSPRTVESVSASGNKMILTFSGSVAYTDIITIDYIKPAENSLQSVTGDQLFPFSNHSVINNLSSGRSQINIYPNPARHYFNISNTGFDQLPQIIRIYSLSGKLFMEKILDTEFLYKVPIRLRPGIYILYIKIGSQPEYSQKLIVVE